MNVTLKCLRINKDMPDFFFFFKSLKYYAAQSAGAVEYTDCISAEG